MLQDVPWIVSKFREFARFYGDERICPDGKYAGEKVIEAIQNHVVLIAENGNPLGFLIAFRVRHPYNPDLRYLAEGLWWVDLGHRGGRAAAMLLDEFTRIGEKEADVVTLSLIAGKTPVKTSNLEKRGFRMKEIFYEKEFH